MRHREQEGGCCCLRITARNFLRFLSCSGSESISLLYILCACRKSHNLQKQLAFRQNYFWDFFFPTVEQAPLRNIFCFALNQEYACRVVPFALCPKVSYFKCGVYLLQPLHRLSIVRAWFQLNLRHLLSTFSYLKNFLAQCASPAVCCLLSGCFFVAGACVMQQFKHH